MGINNKYLLDIKKKYGNHIKKIDWDSDCSIKPIIVWLGHSSFIIKWTNQKILIDPVFSKRVSITPRLIPIPDSSFFNNQVDVVILSHAHMDHMDIPTLHSLNQTTLLLPKKSEKFLPKKILKKQHLENISESEHYNLKNITVTAVVAEHGGWRYPWQKKGFIALGYIISNNKFKIYYAGDTAYGEHFKLIEKKFNPNIAILPIGGYSPQWFLQDKHLNPSESINAAVDLNVSEVIPCHFGTYRVSLEPMDEPLQLFSKYADKSKISWHLPVL